MHFVRREESLLWKGVAAVACQCVLALVFLFEIWLFGGLHTLAVALTFAGAAISMAVLFFFFAHWANAALFWSFALSFDFGMFSVNFCRMFAAILVNEWHLHGFDLIFVIEIISAIVWASTSLITIACFDALIAFDGRLRSMKKGALVAAFLILACLLGLLSCTDVYVWAEAEETELLLWLVSMKPKKHCLAGLSSVLLFLGKFAWSILGPRFS